MTQLYTQLCLTILNRHLKALAKRPVHRFEDLPVELYEQFLKLAELAYNGFKKQIIIFHDELIDNHFGFLDAVPDLYGGCDVSFNFLHFTLQEFFTAYHISKLSDKGVKEFKSLCDPERWNVVLRFVAGLTKFAYLEHVSASLAFVRSSDTLETLFVQCLFEAGDVVIDFWSTLQSSAMSCNLYLGPNSDLDYYALGYCIANCTTPESSWKINLSSSSPVHCHMFAQGLKTNCCSSGVIEELTLEKNFASSAAHLVECLNSVSTSPLNHVINFSYRFAQPQLGQNSDSVLVELISHMPGLQKNSLSEVLMAMRLTWIF